MHPDMKQILAARRIVNRYLRPTPLYSYPGLTELVGANIWVKHENHQPVGAFKVRGGVVFSAGLSEEQRRGGLFTASTGNHGQSIAYGARTFGIEATIAVPEGANPGKVAAMKRLGAQVLFHGPDFDTAREWIMGVAAERGGCFVGPTDDPLICGVASYVLEILEDLPEVATIVVPVGGGSSASAACLVTAALNPGIEVIACQSAQAPAAQKSWSSGKLLDAEMNTFAEGVATRVAFRNTQEIMRRHLSDFILVDDHDIMSAMRLMLMHTHNLVEEAGAIPLAAALQMRERLAGKNVVLVLSGGNLSLAKLRAALELGEAADEHQTTRKYQAD